MRGLDLCLKHYQEWFFIFFLTSPTLVIFCPFDKGILITMRWYVIVNLFFISQMISEFGQFFHLSTKYLWPLIMIYELYCIKCLADGNSRFWVCLGGSWRCVNLAPSPFLSGPVLWSAFWSPQYKQLWSSRSLCNVSTLESDRLLWNYETSPHVGLRYSL